MQSAMYRTVLTVEEKLTKKNQEMPGEGAEKPFSSNFCTV
jgi:hypothetical protein